MAVAPRERLGATLRGRASNLAEQKGTGKLAKAKRTLQPRQHLTRGTHFGVHHAPPRARHGVGHRPTQCHRPAPCRLRQRRRPAARAARRRGGGARPAPPPHALAALAHGGPRLRPRAARGRNAAAGARDPVRRFTEARPCVLCHAEVRGGGKGLSAVWAWRPLVPTLRGQCTRVPLSVKKLVCCKILSIS